jgi:hypothetical protein
VWITGCILTAYKEAIMSIKKRACCTAFLLSVSLAPLLAGVHDQTAKDKAAARITEAMDRQTQILTELLGKLPAQALPAVQDALSASTQGRNTALAALAGHSEPEASALDSPETPQTPNGPDDTASGLIHARDAVSAAFEKSVTTLEGLISTLPAKAAAHVEAALASVQKGQVTALQTLDNLIAKGIPDRASMNLPSRPERPSRPEKLDRPQLPERPQRPEHPQAPGRP